MIFTILEYSLSVSPKNYDSPMKFLLSIELLLLKAPCLILSTKCEGCLDLLRRPKNYAKDGICTLGQLMQISLEPPVTFVWSVNSC